MTCALSSALHAQRLQPPANNGFCDAVLVFGQAQVNAHRCVLAATSATLERALSQSLASTNAASERMILLNLDGFLGGTRLSEDAFRRAVDSLYVGREAANLSEEDFQLVREKFELKSPALFACGSISMTAVKQESAASLMNLPAPPNRQAPPPNTEIPPNVMAPPPSASPASAMQQPMDVSFCHKCDLLFISREECLAHKMLNCTKKFTCKTCGTMFPRVQNLLEHLLDIRHGETVCSVCGVSALSSTEMEAHIGRHAAEMDKPYFCSSCDSRFSSRNGLMMHTPKHSAETPFVCQVCSKGFKWKHALTAHMVTHSSEKKFRCKECGFCTSHTSVFKSHQRMHSGQTMKCGLPGCTFETIRKQNLVQHQLTHSKQKPHQCEVCGKSFSLVKNMRRHALQHDFSALKHICRVDGCAFETLRSDKFVEHMKKHHSHLSEGAEAQGIAGPDAGVISPQGMSKDSSSSNSTSSNSAMSPEDGAGNLSASVVELLPMEILPEPMDQQGQVPVSLPMPVHVNDLEPVVVLSETIRNPAAELAKSESQDTPSPGSSTSASSGHHLPPPKPALAKNLFNTVNPPNRTITQSDSADFEHAVAAAAVVSAASAYSNVPQASEEETQEVLQMVSPNVILLGGGGVEHLHDGGMQ